MNARIIKSFYSYVRPLAWFLMMGWVTAISVPMFSDFESLLLPVVSDFQVHQLRREPESVTLAGSMRKRRECSFLGMTIYVGDLDNRNSPRERLGVTFLDQPEDLSPTRLRGIQTWGPWRIRRPGAVDGPDFWIETRHQCHPLWETQTLNIRLNAEAVFGDG